MANTCFARVFAQPLSDTSGAAFPAAEVKARIEALHYEQFDVLSFDEDPTVEIECGFHWSPPFDELLAVSADLHVDLLCTYHEDGCCFMGAWRAIDGKVVKDESIDY